MVQYRNINSGILVSSSEYYAMSYSEQRNYRISTNRSNNTPTTSSNDTGGFMTSAIIGHVTDSALLGGLLGGDMIGGIVGDMFSDGDLMD